MNFPERTPEDMVHRWRRKVMHGMMKLMENPEVQDYIFIYLARFFQSVSTS